MSQEKVDKYKENKAKRKEIIAKEKKKATAIRTAAWVIAAVVVIGVVGAIGLTIKNERQEYLDSLPSYSTTSYLVSDDAGILVSDDAQ